MTFADLSVPPELIAALAKQQISGPSPIQIVAIPPLAAGKDAYLRAETGTGKTLAYLLPLFSRIDPAQAATQVVIVSPTHELAIQIHRQSCELALNAACAIRSVLLIGGTTTDAADRQTQGQAARRGGLARTNRGTNRAGQAEDGAHPRRRHR